MILGILKESGKERRVAMLPESLAILIKMMVTVHVEKEAGDGSFAFDADYVAVGAKVLTKEEVIRQSDILIKINPPTENESDSRQI